MLCSTAAGQRALCSSPSWCHLTASLVPPAAPTWLQLRRPCWQPAVATTAAQLRPQGLSSSVNSSHTQQQAKHGVRCFSTASPGGPTNPSSIPWLVTAEVLRPLPSSNNNNGSNNGNGSSSSSSAGTVRPEEFSAITEEELQLQPGDAAGSFDAVMILAGGLTPDGGLPDYVHRRLDLARGLHLLQQRRPALVCLGGGTPHKPAIIGPTGHVLHESTSCAAYLIATGVQPDSIYKETSSYDTVGNAYFSLTMHALPAGWRRIAVVTSRFHMPRSRALFADMYRAGGRSLFNDPNRFQLSFFSASDDGVFDQHVYSARLAKEAGSLAHWQSVAPTLPDLPALHAWLFADHLCYAVQRQHEFGKRTIQDPKLLESY